jgi:hypothetical protein
VRRLLWISALLFATCSDSDPGFGEGEGEAEGEDPCDEDLAALLRFGIDPGMCPGTSTACTDPQAPTGCNVRPGALTCTAPPGSATVINVPTDQATIAAAVAAIPNPTDDEYWVEVQSGTYTENVTVTQATTGGPITVAARCVGGSRDSVTIQASTADPVLKVANTSAGVTIEGFRILASATAAAEGAVTILGADAVVRDVVVDGADLQAGFYVGGNDCEIEEIDAIDCKYGLQTSFANNVDLERGAFCDSLETGIQIEGGSGFRANATLAQDSAVAGVHVDLATDTRFTRLLTRGHTAASGFGIELWDATGFDLWHSQVSENSFGLYVDLGATDVEVENVLFSRHTDARAVEVAQSYTAADQLRIRSSTFADGLYAIRVLAPIDVRIDRNIFFAGSAPGGYGIDVTSGAATLSAWDGSADPLENLFYGNYGMNQQCQDYGSGECNGIVDFSGDPVMLGDGYYLEDVVTGGVPISAAVNASATNANSVTLGDGTKLSDYTTSLDLDLDGNAADLGFHHPPCFETVGDQGCGDGYCAGGETSGSCARDCL